MHSSTSSPTLYTSRIWINGNKTLHGHTLSSCKQKRISVNMHCPEQYAAERNLIWITVNLINICTAERRVWGFLISRLIQIMPQDKNKCLRVLFRFCGLTKIDRRRSRESPEEPGWDRSGESGWESDSIMVAAASGQRTTCSGWSFGGFAPHQFILCGSLASAEKAPVFSPSKPIMWFIKSDNAMQSQGKSLQDDQSSRWVIWPCFLSYYQHGNMLEHGNRRRNHVGVGSS